MNRIFTKPVLFMISGVVLILIVLCGIVCLTMWLSIRLQKMDVPERKRLLLVGFIQIVLFVLAIGIGKELHPDQTPVIVCASGVMLLSGILAIHWVAGFAWKPSLKIWALASALQLVIMPVCAMIMLYGLIISGFIFFPPQY